VVVGDFTGDGRQSVAVLNSSMPPSPTGGLSPNAHDQVTVFLGNGDGTFQAPRVFDLESGSSLGLDFGLTTGQLVARDFNGDGRLDLAVVYQMQDHSSVQGHSFVEVLLGNGDGTFQGSQPIQVADGSYNLAAADLGNNGKLDLVATSVRGAVSVLRGNGDGTFQAPVTFQVGGPLVGVAVGDFAGNGHQDLAIADSADNTVEVLLGNGDGTFGAPVAFHVGSSPETVVVGDFFRDGKLSLAVENSYSGSVSVLRGNGDGTFQTAVNFMVGDSTTSLAVGDFLGHGMIDLATTSFGGATVTVLLNQGDGSTQPPPAVEGIVVNDGSVQRSQVTSLTVTFSSQVSLGQGALEVRRQDGTRVPIRVSTSVVGGKTVAVLTFTGDDVVAGSLPDGSYELTVHHALVHDGSGQALAQDAGLSFFRLAGDIDGDGDLDDQDLQAAAPTVSSVRLNEGDTSGAQVSSITLHFTGVITLAPGAFQLLQQGGGAIGLVVSTSTDTAGNTVAVLTFTGDVPVNGALPDGAYTLTVHGGLIHDGQGLALGGAFAGDNAADFFGADGSDQPDLVGLFHPVGG
jgi:hypothetical protein